MILLIDNYDSFVYNLARYVSELGCTAKVVRNNTITLDEIAELRPTHIIISPGPKAPEQAGVSVAVIQHFAPSTPILGVCLGHQAIAYAFSATIKRAKYPMHGKSSFVTHNDQDIFQNLPNPLMVARYHSLIVSEENFPACLQVTSHSTEDEIMGIKHNTYPTFGVQFHPESIITQNGYDLLNNFLQKT